MEEEKLERSIRKSEIPGLTREEEEAQLAKVIGIAEQNLEQAKADIRSANEDLADLMETYDAKEAEGLALWNNATAKLNAYQHGMARLEKARKKPYFGRIDFQDPRLSFLESYYIGRVGISDEKAEPVGRRNRSSSGRQSAVSVPESGLEFADDPSADRKSAVRRCKTDRSFCLCHRTRHTVCGRTETIPGNRKL